MSLDARLPAARAFDDHWGEWTTRLRVLGDPLSRPASGEGRWCEYVGVSSVRPVLGGRANLVELVAAGERGRLDVAALRLFEPGTGLWSLSSFSGPAGVMSPPVVGGFRDGIGVFHGRDEHDGEPVAVRFVITRVDVDTLRFEQAFSRDLEGAVPDAGDVDWEVNWVAVDTRRWSWA